MNAHQHIHDAIPDGPGGLASPAELAEAAAEAVRFLNHATFRGGYVWPSDVAAVLAELLLLTERLPQALEQARRWLADQAADGRVGHDNDPSRSGAADLAVNTVGEVSRALQDVQAPLAQLAPSLQDARNAASHLTGLPGRPGDMTVDGESLGGGVR